MDKQDDNTMAQLMDLGGIKPMVQDKVLLRQPKIKRIKQHQLKQEKI